MKTVYLVRHAKSSWKHDVIDHQRPLKGRGRKDGKLVSEYVKNNITAPEKIFSSDAVRAKTTAIYFKEAFEIDDTNFTTSDRLYDFSGHNVVDFIHEIDDSIHCVMIVGHNHAFTSIANMLGNTYIDNVPTCGFVQLEFEDEEWKTIVSGKTISTVFPRDLKK